MAKRLWRVAAILLLATGAAQAIPPTRIDPGIDFGDGQATAISVSGRARLRYNNSTHVFEQSLNGAAYTTLGSGGGTSTLAAAYAAGASQTDSTMLLDATRLGVRIRDNATPIAGSLFAVQNSAGSSTFFGVTPSTITLGANAVPAVDATSSLGSSSFRWVNVYTNIVDSGSTDLLLRASGNNRLTITNASSNTLTSGMADGASAVAAIVDTTTAWSNATAELVSFRNNTAEKLAIMKDGTVAAGASLNLVLQSAVSTINKSTATDGASAVAAIVDTSTAWSNSAAKLLSVRNNGVEKVSVLQDGRVTSASYYVTADATAGGYYNVGTTAGVILNTASSDVAIYPGNVGPYTDFAGASGNATHRWTETWSRRYAGVEQTVAGAATLTLDPASGETIRLTLNATTINAAGISAGTGKAGEHLTLIVVQDTTARTLTQANFSSSWSFAAGAYTVTATANKQDVLYFSWNATASKWMETGRALNQ